MSRHILDYQEFYALIERFSREVPKILRSHHATADLVPRVSGLLDAMESGFTVAVVGQMRSGKSSLLNAVMNADLAVTGVNETTATVNHFVYGTGEQYRKFRVYWRDRPAEDFPPDEIRVEKVLKSGQTGGGCESSNNCRKNSSLDWSWNSWFD